MKNIFEKKKTGESSRCVRVCQGKQNVDSLEVLCSVMVPLYTLPTLYTEIKYFYPLPSNTLPSPFF